MKGLKTSQGSVTPLGWNNGHQSAFRPYSSHRSVHYLVSGSSLIRPPFDFLHKNTRLSNVNSLAWLSYVYLPSYFEKASSVKTTSSWLAPRGTLYKPGKNLILIFRYSFGDSITIPPCCPSIPFGMLDNIKNISLYSNLSDSFGNPILCSLFVHSVFIWLRTLFKYVPKSHIRFDCRIWLVWTFHKSFIQFRTFVRYVSTMKIPQNQFLTTCIR